jgi:hypothetical protein
MSSDQRLKIVFSNNGVRSLALQERAIKLLYESLKSLGFNSDPTQFSDALVEHVSNQVSRQLGQNNHAVALQEPFKTAFFETVIDNMLD